MGSHIICSSPTSRSREGDDGKAAGKGEGGWEGGLICDRDWVGREYI